MSGRSPSGVASLRARFEQNADPESLTPSRGRSPAGSINSDTSRPLSKVRTSFISVGEPSGHMGDLLVGKEAGKPISGDGAEGSEANEHLKPNGTGPTSAPKQAAEHPVKAQEDQNTSKLSMPIPDKPSETTTASSLASVDLGKSTTGGEEKATSAVPADLKSPATASGGEEARKDSPDLGSILKGSAFENEEAQKEAASQKPAASSTPKATGPTGGGSKTHTAPATTYTVKPPASVDKSANGKPKESQATQAKLQVKPALEKAAASKAQGAPEPVTTADTKASGKKPEKKEISTKPAPSAASTSGKRDRTPKTNPASSAPTNTIAAAAAAPKKEPVPPKSQPLKEPTKEAAKERRPSTDLLARKMTHPTETSGSSNPKMAPSTAPANSKPSAKKAVHPTSSPALGTGFIKPKTRSPTRPANLPSHLTAQTAASAAKHGDDSHVEPHKDRSAGNDQPPGARAPTHHPLPQRKPPRASMPAAVLSRAAEKEKPKPRMSVAGGSAPGGSFLERMMRPTQSSAQKTHDRAEPGKDSPPRKVSGERNVSGAGSKTATGASTCKPDQHAHNDGGHGEGREKHGGPTKSEVDHEEGQEARGTAKGKERVATAADSEASAPEAKPASAPEEPKLPVAPSIMEEAPKDQVDPAAGPDSGMKEA